MASLSTRSAACVSLLLLALNGCDGAWSFAGSWRRARLISNFKVTTHTVGNPKPTVCSASARALNCLLIGILYYSKLEHDGAVCLHCPENEDEFTRICVFRDLALVNGSLTYFYQGKRHTSASAEMAVTVCAQSCRLSLTLAWHRPATSAAKDSCQVSIRRQ